MLFVAPKTHRPAQRDTRICLAIVGLDNKLFLFHFSGGALLLFLAANLGGYFQRAFKPKVPPRGDLIELILNLSLLAILVSGR